MNVYPIVFSFLIALTLGASIIFDIHKDSKLFLIYSHKNLESEQNIQKQITIDIFSCMKKNFKGKTSKEDPTSTETKKSLKKKYEPKFCTRINLYPLLDVENPKEDLRYQITLKFLCRYYQNLCLLQEVHARQVLEQLLDKILFKSKEESKKKPSFSLEKISFQDPLYQNVFYKILKGTNYFDHTKNIGYPSFKEYFFMQKEGKNKVCFLHASQEILSVIFNEAITEKIFTTPVKNGYVKKSLVQEICLAHNFMCDEICKNLLVFSHNPSSTTEQKSYLGSDTRNQYQSKKTVYVQTD